MEPYPLDVLAARTERMIGYPVYDEAAACCLQAKRGWTFRCNGDAWRRPPARQLEANLLVFATDVDGVYLEFGRSGARRLEQATQPSFAATPCPPAPWGPRVQAACNFVERTGQWRSAL